MIMIALLMLSPVSPRSASSVPTWCRPCRCLRGRGTDIALHGLDSAILVPLVIGSVPGTLIGSKIAPRVRQSVIRRGIVIVLTMSGVALLDKAGWAPLGAGDGPTPSWWPWWAW